MNNPVISVIMPVYNVEAYIAEAIESVLAQTMANFELLIIDDGGDDRSIEIASGYHDPRIRIISQCNRGLAGARNSGIRHARADLIAFLDSDDRWVPEKLMLHMIHMKASPNVGLSYAGSRFIDEQGVPLRQAQRPKVNNITPAHIFCRNPVGNGSAPVIRRSALDHVAFSHPTDTGRICYFDESFRQSEDIEMWMRLALLGNCKFEGIDAELTQYRIAAGGLSANVTRQFESWQRMLAKIEGYAPEFAAKYGDKARAYQLRYLARRCIQMGDGSFALSLAKESLNASLAPLWEETARTISTFGAAMIARSIGPEKLAKLARRWTGAKVVT